MEAILDLEMPVYEYRCTKGHTFEVMQRMSDGPVTKCEVCDRPVARVFHPPAVHFKGSGFYNTDYGTRKRSREKESSEAGNKDTTTTSSNNSDSSKSKDSSSSSSGEKSDSGAKKPDSKSKASSSS